MQKRILLILCGIFGFVAVACGVFFLTRFLDSLDPMKHFSDADRLTSVDSWVSTESDSLVWSFNRDGTCRVTTNGTEFFDCLWSLSDSVLTLRTSWLIDLDDTFTLDISPDASVFTIKNNSTLRLTEFHALGRRG